MKKKRLLTQTLALVLCFALLCPLTAFADGNTAIPADPDSYAVIDPAEMKGLVDKYVKAHSLDKDEISVGYCYLDTGDTWYYNGDNWYFGAGVYYVPLMMILAEWESSGKVTRDTTLKGITLGDAERYILVYSNNYYAHEMMHTIGSDKEVREKYRAYSPLPEEYYDPDFLEYSYFSARFLTDVMKTLYNENERFPNIIENLKVSDSDSYFHGAMHGQYEVAQKYGNFIDKRNVEYNNCTGIFYTPHPFILTVMTKNMGIKGEIMRDMAIIFKDYTLSLDEAYEAYVTNPAPAAAQTPAEPASSETETGTGEAGTEIPLPPAAESEPNTEEPAAEIPLVPAAQGETQAEQQQENPAAVPAAPAQQQETNPSIARRMAFLMMCAGLLVILCLAAILKPILRKKKEREEEEEEELQY